MKKLTFMFAMLLMAVVSFGQEAVVLPDNLFAEEFTFEGTHVTTGAQKTPATVNVAVDGNDVYMQGLAYAYPEGWVKGTLDGDKVTFAANQYMGENYYFCPDYDVVFTYNADEPSYESAKYEISGSSNYWEVYRDIKLYIEQPLTADEIISQMTVSPEAGSTQTSLQTFTLTFPVAVTVDDTQLPTLNDAYGTIGVDASGMVVTVGFDEVTEPGVYTLLVPFGAILYDGLPLADFEYEYNILPAPELSWSINPAEGKVESLKNFTLTFKDGTVNFNQTGYTEPVLTKDGESVLDNGRIYVHSSGVQVYDIMFGSSLSEDDAITEDGTYVLTIHAADFTNKATGEAINGGEDLVFTYTIGEGGEEPIVEPGTEDELVSLPEGITAEEYQFKGVKPGYSIFPAEDITGTVQVAFDGNDVYVQGLSREEAPEAWVKGVRDGENITFAKKQLLTKEETTRWNGTTMTTYYYFNANDDVVFAYDETNNKMTAEQYVINSDIDNAGDYAASETITGVEIYKEGGDEPVVEPTDELVTPPATAEQKDYIFEAADKYYTTKTYKRDVKVAVDGTDVYFQGLSSQMPEAWVKGTMAEGNVTVAGKQLLGTYVEDNTAYGGEKKEFDLYFSPEVENVVFAYNADEDAYTTAAYGIDVMTDALGKNEDYTNVKIYTEPFDVMQYVAIDPEAGTVESLGGFTVTFGEYAIERVDASASATLKNNTTGDEDYSPVMVLAGKKIMLSFAETTTPGEYTLTIPAGAVKLTDMDVEVPELTFNYNIEAPVVFSWTIDPAEGNVESLTNIFKIQFENGNVAYDYTKEDPTLTKDGEELAEFKSMSITSQRADIYFGSMTETQTYTEDGTYVLTIPAGTLTNNGEAMDELTFTWTIGEEVNPGDDVVVVPATATVEDWTKEASVYTGSMQTVKENAQVAFDGEDIYIQGLSTYLPEAWVKGTFDGTKAVLKSGQFFGNFEYDGETYPLYMMIGVSSADGNSMELADEVTLNYDADAEQFTLEGAYILENVGNAEISYAAAYVALTLTKGAYEAPTLVELPEGAVVEDWTFTAYDTYYEENVTRPSQVAFVGNDVYVNGISESMSSAWIKGTLEGDKVTFAANQYMGVMDSYYGSDDFFFSPDADVVFDYDAEAGKLTAAAFTTDWGGYVYDEMEDIVITKVVEMAGTPATPTIIKADIADNYPYVQATIPSVDTEGNVMAASKLGYVVMVEDEEGIAPLTLTADLYYYFEEDMTVIPYLFTDEYDIQLMNDTRGVYLNQDAEVLNSWYRIGVKSIYTGGGETHESEIGWYVLKEKNSTGISNIMSDEDGAIYFDAMGRRTNGEAKGLLIKQVRQADGTVKTVKMARK